MIADMFEMKVLFLVSSILYSSFSMSASWLCREAASARNGDIINACGVGEANSESEARAKARDLAFEELDSICAKTPDCSNFEYVIQPLRTDCEKNAQGYKCYRGIEATITNVRRDSSAPRPSNDKVFVPVKKVVIQEDLVGNKVSRSVIQFNSKPTGASVNVDGIQICETPCSRELQLGHHQIIIEKRNYESFETSLKVSNETPEVFVELVNMFGFLDVSDIPMEAKIKIDDIRIGDEAKIKLMPGKHIVTVESPYHQPYFKEVNIKKGVSSKLHNVLEPLFGFLDISAKDRDGNALKAVIYIDGERTENTTPSRLKVASGQRKIELSTNSSLYVSATRTIEPDTVYNLNFVLSSGTRSVARQQPRNRGLLENIFQKPLECNSDSNCDLGFQCATIRGEYPGTCVKKGLGF